MKLVNVHLSAVAEVENENHLPEHAKTGGEKVHDPWEKDMLSRPGVDVGTQRVGNCTAAQSRQVLGGDVINHGAHYSGIGSLAGLGRVRRCLFGDRGQTYCP